MTHWRSEFSCDRLGSMRETELRRLIAEEFLSVIQDPRVERTRKHPMETILVISLLAVICGADTIVDIENYAKSRKQWLDTFLDMSGGVPSHDTIGRLFAALNPLMLGEAFRRWTRAMATASNDKLIAIDGKTLRRAFKHAGDGSFVHMVSAWSNANGVVLGQVQTEEGSNEITAIPALLDLIDVKATLVTIDAAGTQVEIAQKIVDHGGDYLLAVKANQPTLQQSMALHFLGVGRLYNKFKRAEFHDHAHGREESRSVSVGHAIEEIATAERWPKLATLIHVESTRTVDGVTSTAHRYYISSRRKLSPQQALAAVRGHWGIENQLHWVLDVAFREDESRVRAGNAAANFSAIRQLALGLLRKRTEQNGGIKARRLVAGWNNDFLLRVIGLQP
jgi:predicted transposase YbfD/YdcC